MAGVSAPELGRLCKIWSLHLKSKYTFSVFLKNLTKTYFKLYTNLHILPDNNTGIFKRLAEIETLGRVYNNTISEKCGCQ